MVDPVAVKTLAEPPDTCLACRHAMAEILNGLNGDHLADLTQFMSRFYWLDRIAARVMQRQ